MKKYEPKAHPTSHEIPVTEIIKAKVLNAFQKSEIKKSLLEELELRTNNEGDIVINLPKKMIPGIESWEKLGFMFAEINNEHFYKVVIPKSWILSVSDNNDRELHFLDESNKLRARTYIPQVAGLDIDPEYTLIPQMELLPYYKINITNLGKVGDNTPSHINEVWFGNQEEVLFVAGRLHTPINDTDAEEQAFDNKIMHLEQAAEKYAEENYPLFKDPLAYWNTKQKVQKM